MSFQNKRKNSKHLGNISSELTADKEHIKIGLLKAKFSYKNDNFFQQSKKNPQNQNKTKTNTAKQINNRYMK